MKAPSTSQTFAFRLGGRDGLVAADYGPDEDPERWGYGILGLPWPSRLALGLPVLRAAVSSEGEGYETVMGWIQIVRIHVSAASQSLVPGAEKAPAGDHVWVDGPPNLRGLGVPFVSFGPCPTLFDAPASTESSVRFVAESFLTASPDALMTRDSRPCLGLRWGYSTLESGNGPAELLPLTGIGLDEWRDSLATLEEQFPDWSFDSNWFT
jgi:hypothetical protein